MDVVPDSVPAFTGGSGASIAPDVVKTSELNSRSTSLTASSGLTPSKAKYKCPTCGLGHGKEAASSGDLEVDCADGAATRSCPAHSPEYALYSSRLETYQGWPEKVVGQKPSKMAEAGLFYIGSADRVQCFYCGKRLRNWEKGDDPKVEHRDNCPDCLFAQECLKPGFTCLGMEPSANQLSEEPHHPRSNHHSVSSQESSGYFSQGSLGSLSSNITSSQPGSTTTTQTSQTAPQEAQLPTQDRRTNGDGVDYDKYGIMMEAVKQFGVSEDAIRRALESRHNEGGPEFKHAGELFEAAERVMRDTQAGGSVSPWPEPGNGSGSRSLPYSSQMPSLPAAPFSSLTDNLHALPPLSSSGLLPSSPAPSVSTPPSASNTAVVPPSSQTTTTTSNSAQPRNPPSQRSSGLLEENRRLHGDFRCRACRSNPCDTTFLPCGHYVTCRDCASRMTNCCVCNRQVMGTVRTYLA